PFAIIIEQHVLWSRAEEWPDGDLTGVNIRHIDSPEKKIGSDPEAARRNGIIPAEEVIFCMSGDPQQELAAQIELEASGLPDAFFFEVCRQHSPCSAVDVVIL